MINVNANIRGLMYSNQLTLLDGIKTGLQDIHWTKRSVDTGSEPKIKYSGR